MSITDLNNNTTFDYVPSEIKVNRTTNFKNNLNYSTISRKKNSQIIYGTGVDDYVFNEIKKAKYQGCFDPGSLGNKNIFNDNNNIKITNTENNINKKINSRNAPKIFDKNKKYSNHIHKHDEGKNLLIAKSEIQYPLKFDKYHYLLINKNNINNNNDSVDNYFNSYPITIKRNYKSKKNKSNLSNNYSYYTPAYDDRKYGKYVNELDADRYQNKTIAMNTLMNSYNENSRIMNNNRDRKNLKYSIDKNSAGSNVIFNQRDYYYSPIVFPNRYSAYPTINNNSKKRRKILTVNSSKSKSNENFLRNLSNSKKELIGGIQFDTENNDDDGNDDDVKLINVYRNKLLTLFFMHMGKFHLLYLRKVFNEFIELIKEYIKNPRYHFENKTIIDIPEIKKNLISKSYYYGYNKQYVNLLKDIKYKKNLEKTNQIDNKKVINLPKNYVKNNYNNPNDNKKNKVILNNNKIINKNRIIDDTSNKKYIKKKVTAKGVFRNSKKKVGNNQKEIKIGKVNLKKNYLTNQENSKITKSLDKIDNLLKKNSNININKKIDKKIITSYNVSTIVTKNNKDGKFLPFKKSIINSLTIKNKKRIIPNKINKNNNLIKNNISIHSIKKKFLIKNNDNNNNIKVIDIMEGKTCDEKFNMSMKYLEINSNSASPRNKDDRNNLKIENALVYTIIGEKKNQNNNEENPETFENNNFQNAISIITKIMENKEKDDEKKNILNSILQKLVERKINKEKKYNYELLKKYFLLFRTNEEVFPQKKKKYSFDLLETRKIIKDENCEEGNLSSNRESRKFRVVIKKIKLHRSIINNIIDARIRKLNPIKSAKNNLPILTDVNDIPSKKIIKQTISITVNRDIQNKNKSFDKGEIKELVGNKEIKKVSNDSILEKEKEKIIKKEESIDNYNNLSLPSEKNNEDNNFTNSEKHLYRNLKLIKKSKLNRDKRKSLANIPRIKSSIENFTKYRKNKQKLNNSRSFKEGDISQNELYQDYENLIFYLRTQLIYCFIANNKYNESYND